MPFVRGDYSFETFVVARSGPFERDVQSKAGITGRLSLAPMGALAQVYRCAEPF